MQAPGFEILQNPARWPRAALLPAALLRVTAEEVERRVKRKLAPFVDDDGPAVGWMIVFKDQLLVALVQHPGIETTPSIYLPANELDHPEFLTRALAALHLKRSEVLYRQADFTPEQIRRGLHLLPSSPRRPPWRNPRKPF
jgi:hypothetical protein